MKRFLTNILLFFVLPLVVYTPVYLAFYYYHQPKATNPCYVWGDSQMCQDVDLDYLNQNSQYKYFSAAAPGAGLYDFLVFADKVPENSTVLIQVSRTVLLRRKEKDRNVSAISIGPLATLLGNGYTINEVGQVVKNNLFPKRIFYTINYLYRNADTISTKEPVSTFEAIFKTKPAYFEDKKTICLKGIETLMKKHCKIVAIQFPYHQILNKIEANSPYRQDLEKFDNDVAARFAYQQTIEIKLKENIFTDLTHLNERGAKELSRQLAPYLDFKQSPIIIKVKQGE